MKHLLFIFMTLVCCLFLPICTLYAENIEIDGINYNLNYS